MASPKNGTLQFFERFVEYVAFDLVNEPQSSTLDKALMPQRLFDKTDTVREGCELLQGLERIGEDLTPSGFC
jgi:hypothetical protein